MRIIEEFKEFALRGNLMEMAVGFTVGAAFTTIAKSLVTDIIMPPVGLMLGGVNFNDLFIVLKQGAEPLAPRATLAQAQEIGAVTLNYGIFVNNLLAFAIVAVAMFLFIHTYNRIDKQLDRVLGDEDEVAPQEPTNKKCPFCRSTIPKKATRCPQCTSQLDKTPA